jgi:hypothetical protein
MHGVRTYFPYHIVSGEERRYDVDSSGTSCLKVFATSFGKIMGKNA